MRIHPESEFGGFGITFELCKVSVLAGIRAIPPGKPSAEQLSIEVDTIDRHPGHYSVVAVAVYRLDQDGLAEHHARGELSGSRPESLMPLRTVYAEEPYPDRVACPQHLDGISVRDTHALSGPRFFTRAATCQ